MGAAQGPRRPRQQLRRWQRRGSGWADLRWRWESKTAPCKSTHEGSPGSPPSCSLPFWRRPGHFVPARSLNAAPTFSEQQRRRAPRPTRPVAFARSPHRHRDNGPAPGSGAGGARAFVGTIVPCAHSGGWAGSASRGLSSEVARFRPERNPDCMGWGRGGPVPSGVGALARSTGSPEAQGVAMAPFWSTFYPAARGLGPHTGGRMSGSAAWEPSMWRAGRPAAQSVSTKVSPSLSAAGETAALPVQRPVSRHAPLGARKWSQKGETDTEMPEKQRRKALRKGTRVGAQMGSGGPVPAPPGTGGQHAQAASNLPASGRSHTARPRQGWSLQPSAWNGARGRVPPGWGPTSSGGPAFELVGGGQGVTGQTPGLQEPSSRPHAATRGFSPELSQLSAEKWSGFRSSETGSHVMWGTVSIFSPGFSPLSLSSLNFFLFT